MASDAIVRRRPTPAHTCLEEKRIPHPGRDSHAQSAERPSKESSAGYRVRRGSKIVFGASPPLPFSAGVRPVAGSAAGAVVLLRRQ